MPQAANTLYCGDNLDILRRYIDDESVDLIYLDLPMNSIADYDVVLAEKDGTQTRPRVEGACVTCTSSRFEQGCG